MSRLAQSRSAPLARRSGGGDAQDVCESCVDRIFSHGPSQCPIPGCRKTLRKHRFREQTFEDIQVEREVDIRKRVAAVFNRREDDFESLRDYNDYLNEVEDITFNLINNIDLEDTQKKFDKYQAAHEEEIMENASLAEKERMQFAAGQKAEREQARQRRDAARREEAEEKREVLEGKKDVLNRLASGQDAESVAQEGQKVQLKKRMDRAAAAERQRQLQQQPASAASEARNGSSNLVIKGLKAKTKKTTEPEAPIDPFGGLSFEGRKYYSLQDDYVWAGVQETKTDALIGAGGYDVSSFTRRALCEAFAGLGVFVGEEIEERERRKEDGDKVGTKGAEVVAQGREKKVKIEDPF
ncbi:TFIIH/NER complex subunit [Vermiconidia calcicola]|uniref:TFIIH/NER complex subunit n=1 Tax=Vermiconidia calcicola TaxID=1690605 RepID=A0ACC3NDA5_9PEZI|nr:TFIIH/NER complex subunit [Vermiconidia calcicola]